MQLMANHIPLSINYSVVATEKLLANNNRPSTSCPIVAVCIFKTTISRNVRVPLLVIFFSIRCAPLCL